MDRPHGLGQWIDHGLDKFFFYCKNLGNCTGKKNTKISLDQEICSTGQNFLKNQESL